MRGEGAAVAVDQHRPDALVDVVAGHDVLGQPVFEGERRVEVVIPPDRRLAQRDFEVGRQLGEQVGAGFGGPSCMRPTG